MSRHPRQPHLGRDLVTAAAALILIFTIGCAGVRHVGNPTHPLPSTRDDAPFVFIYCTSGYSSRLHAGTLVAVWNDGTIVRAASEEQLGQSYVRSRLTPAQLAHVRSLLGASGLLTDHSEQFLVIDAPAENLTVRYGARLKTWAHSPGFEDTGNHDSTDPRITRLKHALLALPLETPTPHPPHEFTSYPHD